MLFAAFFLIFKDLISFESEDEFAYKEEDAHLLSFFIIVTLCLLMIEMPIQLRIFDFFAPFVSSLHRIMKDSIQIGIILFSVVIVWTFIFWILDQSSDVEAYQGYAGGIGSAFVDSYRLTLGDFEVTESFS